MRPWLWSPGPPKIKPKQEEEGTTNSFNLYNNVMALYLCDIIKKHKQQTIHYESFSNIVVKQLLDLA